MLLPLKNGSRAFPITVPAGSPEGQAGPAKPLTASATPQPMGRVVAGSRMAPVGKTRPKISVFVPDAKLIRSCRLVKLLLCIRFDGTIVVTGSGVMALS